MIINPENKVAVITGGAGGIGSAMAKHFLEQGMRVAIADISEEQLNIACAELNAGNRLLTVVADVSTPEGNQSLANRVENYFGQINLVCLNAGIGRLRPLSQVSSGEWNLQVAVNLNGPFYGIKAFMPLLEKSREAHIVITASVMSLFAAPIMGPYYATKAAVLSLAESLYLELEEAGSHIGISALMPGDTRTNVVANNATDDTDPELLAAAAEELAKATPPELIAEDVLKAVQENRFYILPNPGGYLEIIDKRMTRIHQGANPQVDYTTL